VSDIESDWEGEDDLGGRPYGGRPYGGRPYGARPYGGKPYGGKPYGGKPYGGKPYGGRPYGGRPYGGKPYGGKPYGGKPYGGRPYGGRPYGGKSADGEIDFDEWTADTTDLFCSRSAPIQHGATVVGVEDQYWIPTFGPQAVVRPAVPAPGALAELVLEPGAHTVDAAVAVPSGVLGRLGHDPESASALKADLVEALVRAVDNALLVTLPRSISTVAPGVATVANDLLATLRAVVAAVLANPLPPSFRNPGWILHPLSVERAARLRTLDGQTESAGVNARPLAEYDLLRLDSAAGGQLLGMPFVTSGQAVDAAGAPRIYFGADWDEAWIGVDPDVTTVSTPGGPVVAGARLIRASLSLDFALRRLEAFAWADSP
jgi:capsid protein